MVTINEHLDGKVSIRWGPHVVGRFAADGGSLEASNKKAERRGKGGSMEAGENQKQVFTGSHTPLEISQKARDSHFPTAPTTVSSPRTETKQKQNLNGGGGKVEIQKQDSHFSTAPTACGARKKTFLQSAWR